MKQSELYSEILERDDLDISSGNFLEAEYLEKSEETNSLIAAWIKTIQEADENHGRPQFYDSAQKALSNTNASPDEVLSFCDQKGWNVKETKYPTDPGIFISAAINESSFEEFIIPENTELSCLGYNNRKKIRIEGNAGGSIGAGMSDGEILIEGDVDEVGGDISNKMRGGEIYVKGDYDQVGLIEEGEVYVKESGDWKPVSGWGNS